MVNHPEIADIAVFGVPQEDSGEEIKVVVQPEAGVEPRDELTDALDRIVLDVFHRRTVPAQCVHGRTHHRRGSGDLNLPVRP
nr:hypothetical protein [Rhodococcus sp. 1168]